MYKRQGMKILAEKGVNHVEADVIRRNEQQRLLAASCGATFVRTACYLSLIHI